MQMFIIRWQSGAGKVWESERYAATALEALRVFRLRLPAKIRGTVKVLGVADAAGPMSLQLI